MPHRPPHLAGITRLETKFSGTDFRVEIKQKGRRVICGYYRSLDRAMIARMLAVHWNKIGYQLDGTYQYEHKR